MGGSGSPRSFCFIGCCRQSWWVTALPLLLSILAPSCHARTWHAFFSKEFSSIPCAQPDPPLRSLSRRWGSFPNNDVVRPQHALPVEAPSTSVPAAASPKDHAPPEPGALLRQISDGTMQRKAWFSEGCRCKFATFNVGISWRLAQRANGHNLQWPTCSLGCWRNRPNVHSRLKWSGYLQCNRNQNTTRQKDWTFVRQPCFVKFFFQLTVHWFSCMLGMVAVCRSATFQALRRSKKRVCHKASPLQHASLAL